MKGDLAACLQGVSEAHASKNFLKLTVVADSLGLRHRAVLRVVATLTAVLMHVSRDSRYCSQFTHVALHRSALVAVPRFVS